MRSARVSAGSQLTMLTALLAQSAVSPAGAQSASAPARVYVCPPCPADCHDRRYDKPGACPVCGMTLIEQDAVRNVAIMVWDGVELLDFAGPGEVFAAARIGDQPAFRVFTVAPRAGAIVAQGFVKIEPTYTIENCPPPHVLVIPGGASQQISDDPAVIKWVQRVSNDTEMILSVCTGAFVLAKAGLLDQLEATTWHGAINRLRGAAPRTAVLADRRYVDNGDIITSAGVSAGIDGALHAVARLIGYHQAVRTAEYMEYRWRPDPFATESIGEPRRTAGGADSASDPARAQEAGRSTLKALGSLLTTGEMRGADLLGDPRFIHLHEEPAFRELVRDHAAAGSATLAPPGEPGEPLVVSGVVRDETLRPVRGALVYVFHTNAAGVYSSRGGNFGSMGDALNPRLFAYLRTGADGRFEFRTIRPGQYPGDGPPAHVHFQVQAHDFRDLVTELMFEGDSRLTPAAKADFQKQGFAIAKVLGGPDGVQRVACELVLTRRE